MKTHGLRCLLTGVIALAMLVPVAARAGNDEPARALFERFKALEGQWQATSSAGWNEVTSFEVIARGSVVMESTTFRDAPDRKMVTMFYLDGEELVAVHYCEARNQPALLATEIDAERGQVTFTFAGGGNISSRDSGHMDKAVFQFLQADRFTSQWTWFQDGSEQWLEDIEYERLR